MSARTDGFCAERRHVSSDNFRGTHYHTRKCLAERDEYIRELEHQCKLLKAVIVRKHQQVITWARKVEAYEPCGDTGLLEACGTCVACIEWDRDRKERERDEALKRVAYLEKLTAAGTGGTT